MNLQQFICVVVLLALVCSIEAGPLSRHRADVLPIVNNMTLLEKINTVHGVPGPYAGQVPENTRLNIPALYLEDGPQVCYVVRLINDQLLIIYF